MSARGHEEGEGVTIEVGNLVRLTPEARREQTRRCLLDAAQAVFAARGYRGASLSEIAEAAGFTTGAIYSNFGGKEDLFLAVVERRRAAMLEEFFAAAGAEPEARVEAIAEVSRRLSPTASEWALWEEFFLYSLRTPGARATLVSDSDAFTSALVAMVEEQCEGLGVVPPIPVEALARLYMAIFDGLARQAVLQPEAVEDDLFATTVTFIGEAVAALGRPRTAAKPRATKSPR
ncbi:MAG: TetR/AcrR family transcriptional regulator [Actinobacteria bacterium]|nr:TetR/AcrR family transcriptional regulator [Actinomycetota bacterium]